MANKQLFPKPTSNTIAFRLDSDAMKALCERARRTGTSPGVLARTVLEDWLQSDSKIELLRADVLRVQGQLEQLQKTVNQIVPKPAPQEDPWARFNYRRRGW